MTNRSTTTTTISTPVEDLATGDVVYEPGGSREVLSCTTDDGFGTWISWKDGGRDSFPPSFRVHRIVPADSTWTVTLTRDELDYLRDLLETNVDLYEEDHVPEGLSDLLSRLVDAREES